MKKLIIILFVLPFIMTSCSKSYDDPDIVGTWVGSEEDMTLLVIKSNGRYTLNITSDEGVSGKYEYSDNNLKLDTEFGSLTYTVYFYNKNHISLTSGDGCYIPGNCMSLFRQQE